MTARDIREELEAGRRLLEQLPVGGSDGTWAHRSFAHLLGAHGVFYPPAPWPAGQHPGRMGQCFAAAHEWADRMGWTYAEGLALLAEPPFPGLPPTIEHAWCLTADGTVADPAVPDGWTIGYLGLPFSTAFRQNLRDARPGAAIITQSLSGDGCRYIFENTAILREGLPLGALYLPEGHDHERA
ncbi:hypothetical protein [Streptomyces sp. NPDC054838]